MCTGDGCDREALLRGLCGKHYQRFRKSERFYIKETRTLVERLEEKTLYGDKCWTWQATKCAAGYGRIKVGNDLKQAHRVAYELEFGKIPDGTFLDHKCHNKGCVRPTHLRLATPGENRQNLTGAYSNSKSGVRGVSKSGNTWRAVVNLDGKQYSKGGFRSVEEAEAQVIEMRNELFTHNLLDRMKS